MFWVPTLGRLQLDRQLSEQACPILWFVLLSTRSVLQAWKVPSWFLLLHCALVTYSVGNSGCGQPPWTHLLSSWIRLAHLLLLVFLSNFRKKLGMLMSVSWFAWDVGWIYVNLSTPTVRCWWSSWLVIATHHYYSWWRWMWYFMKLILMALIIKVSPSKFCSGVFSVISLMLYPP